jgi:hypothetical protein
MNSSKGNPVLNSVIETLAKLYAATLASLKTHTWWWAGGGGVVLVAVAAVLVVVYGGFFGPSGKAICTTALSEARDYGVVPPDASLASSEAKKTDVENRRVCTAEAGSDQYKLTVDVTCDKVSDKKCLSLYAVARADGLSTYQLRSVPDDQTAAEASEIPPVENPQQPAQSSPPAQSAAPARAPAQTASPDDGIETVTGKPGSDAGMNAQGGDQTPPQ